MGLERYSPHIVTKFLGLYGDNAVVFTSHQHLFQNLQYDFEASYVFIWILWRGKYFEKIGNFLVKWEILGKPKKTGDLGVLSFRI
jgi:hypothetical protein